ncbi:MAG: fatty acid desaturase, partial [Acidobacteriota bacterium]
FHAGRVVQLFLAVVGAQTGQRGPLWWASKHRMHHQHVETSLDPHSPVAHGFTYAYIKWIGKSDGLATDLDSVPDYATFPELRWINRYYWVPYYSGGALVTLAGYFGWFGQSIGALGALLWGFYVPSVLALHSVALINTLGHGVLPLGTYRSFNTSDQSRNRPILAFFTLGAGWHNNHHRFAASARAGFRWYEIDPTYWVLCMLEWLGVIRDLRRAIPSDVLAEMQN